MGDREPLPEIEWLDPDASRDKPTLDYAGPQRENEPMPPAPRALVWVSAGLAVVLSMAMTGFAFLFLALTSGLAAMSDSSHPSGPNPVLAVAFLELFGLPIVAVAEYFSLRRRSRTGTKIVLVYLIMILGLGITGATWAMLTTVQLHTPGGVQLFLAPIAAGIVAIVVHGVWLRRIGARG